MVCWWPGDAQCIARGVRMTDMLQAASPLPAKSDTGGRYIVLSAFQCSERVKMKRGVQFPLRGFTDKPRSKEVLQPIRDIVRSFSARPWLLCSSRQVSKSTGLQHRYNFWILLDSDPFGACPTISRCFMKTQSGPKLGDFRTSISSVACSDWRCLIAANVLGCTEFPGELDHCKRIVRSLIYF